jgi:hypothetical protein
MEAVRRLRVVEGEVEDEGEGWGELMLSSEAELYSSAISSREGDVRGNGETLCERAKRSSEVSCVSVRPWDAGDTSTVGSVTSTSEAAVLFRALGCGV